MYIMYMMYTVSEFRKNIREALSQAEYGEVVEINRHGRVFTLKPTGFVSVVDMGTTVSPGAVMVSLSTPILTKKNKDMEFCKHGSVKGLCKKGCK